MASVRVRGLPDHLHEELRRRARAEGVTLSDLVTRFIRRELAVAANRDWLSELLAEPARETDVDIESLMDEIRAG